MSMTENEFGIVEGWLREAMEYGEERHNEPYEKAIKALEKVQQFEAIGTIEEFKRAKEMEAVYGQVKWERDVAIGQLEEIGVSLGQKMDEFKALKEKSVARKPIGVSMAKDKDKVAGNVGRCPCCNYIVAEDMLWCDECGQKLDWQ